ncbi:MAG: hypothetical protein AABZ43_06145, partial [Planctomycetota bacterium]
MEALPESEENRLINAIIHELIHFIDMEKILTLERRNLRLQRWRNSTLEKMGLDPSLPLNALYLADVIDNLRIEG